MVKLEAGKYYKTRDGRKVGPLRLFGESTHHRYWHVTDDRHSDQCGYLWDGEGASLDYQTDPDLDIVSEWYTSCAAAQVDVQREEYGPIRTRREIVPGTYGVVTVEKDDDGIFAHVECASTADELREAAHLFNQLAGALDDNRA